MSCDVAFVRQDPSRVKKILPFTGELDLTVDTGAVEDSVDDMIQRLDMAMQVRAATAFAIARFRLFPRLRFCSSGAGGNRCYGVLVLVLRLSRGIIVNRTYGIHKNLPGTYLTIFTNNIWSY